MICLAKLCSKNMWEVPCGAEWLGLNFFKEIHLCSFLGSLMLHRMLQTPSLQGTLDFRFLDDLFGKNLFQEHVVGIT
jgi:hypothetical protein